MRLLKEREMHALLPKLGFGIPGAFHTLEIMKSAPVTIMVMNTNEKNQFETIDADGRITEICDSLSIGASIQNMLLKATDLGIGTLWIANTCFAYHELAEFVGDEGQLIGAIALAYPDEQPPKRPRKELTCILEYR